VNTIEDRARAAMREFAGTVTDAPVLRLDPARLQLPQSAEARKADELALRTLPSAGGPAARRRFARLPRASWRDEVTRGRGRRLAGWLAPLTAAAAITVVVAVLVVARGAPSGTSRAHAPAAGATVPEYYVMLHQTSATSVASLVVGDTRTGKQVGAVPAPAGGTFIGVTGAADDRTFVVDAVHGAIGFGPNARPRTWYLLRIFPGSAQPVRLTPVPIPATAEQTVVHWIALSPDGTRLAVALRPAQGPAELRVYSVATGRVLRSWTAPAHSTVIPASSLGIDSDTPLTWLDDGHTLALESTQTSDSINFTTTIRTLDLNRSGTDLITSSRVVWSSVSRGDHSIPGSAPGCLSNSLVLLSGDGKTVICSMIVQTPVPGVLHNQRCVPGTVGLAAYSLTTRRLLRALATYPASCATGGTAQVFPLWASAAGNKVIGYLNTGTYPVPGQKTPGVMRFGVFGAGAFRPLPYPPLPSEVPLPERIAW
jgi:hypothetical protein